MSSISTWILSIAGVICVSVLLELIMPDGQMSKYIKNIFSFVIILVIILPLPKIFNKDVKLDNFFYENEPALQSGYLESVNKSKLNAISKSLVDSFSIIGYDGINLEIAADFTEEKIEYLAVFVDLKHLVIRENAEHKNILEIKEELMQKIFKILGKVEVSFEE